MQDGNGRLYYEGYEDDENQMVEDVDEEQEQEDIITADHYIDDDEEEKANLMKEKQRLKEKILHQPSTSNEGSA